MSMKKEIFLITGWLLLCCFLLNCTGEKARDNLTSNNSFVVFCTPDISNLTTMWVNEFCRLNPDIKIQVVDVNESSIVKNLTEDKSLGFISGDFDTGTNENLTPWKEVIGRDIIVPVINSDNPYLDEIFKKGITKEELASIFQHPGIQNWGTLFSNRNNGTISVYILDNATIKSGIADLLDINQSSIKGKEVKSGEELISSVQRDIYSIGICKIGNLTDAGIDAKSETIKLLPIDRNSNGKIDYLEKIYDDPNMLSRSVWIGKYPKALFKNIYTVSPSKPTGKTEVAFLKWILSDGQKFLNTYGYSDLLSNERQGKIALLNEPETTLTDSGYSYAISKGVLIIAGSLLICALIVLSLYRHKIKSNTLIEDRPSTNDHILDENFVEMPLGLYYDKTHTWAFMEKDGTVKIGIDDFLQHITGPLTRVKMRNTNEKIKKGSQILSIIQNGKQLNIYSPVSGTIKEQNESLSKNSSLINSSPYSDGWVYRIEPSKWLSEIQFLLMGGKYEKWIKNEFSRLKEFFAGTFNPSTEGLTNVLQDGGELKDGILADLGPEVWEDFQTYFLDQSM